MIEERYRKAEGANLFDVFTPEEERSFTLKLAAVAAFVVGIGLAAFASFGA